MATEQERYNSVKVLLEHDSASCYSRSDLEAELKAREKAVRDLKNIFEECSSLSALKIWAESGVAIIGSLTERLNPISGRGE